MSDRRTNVIFDLDGTLADMSHRLYLIQGESPNWDEFFQWCFADEPIPETIRFAQLFTLDNNPARTFYILTGRNSVVREDTERWLTEHEVPYHHLVMRGEGDRRPDVEVKADMLDMLGLTPRNTWLVLEDRDRVVRMYRDRGFTVWQVADGAY